ncbi:uncharacterized protein [Diadema setosum]|uniref:uncharacterized protein n=1 Tax=Diadema setosum TaxID=31175 RepID=UPI003B3A9EC9
MDLHLVLGMLVAMFLLDFRSSKVLGCQCARQKHPQQYMCDADYVIRGKILSETYVPAGGITSSKAPLPTLPPAPTTTKRTPFKFPQWQEPWWEPVLLRPRPREQPQPRPQPRPIPQWQNPFMGYRQHPPLVLADQPPVARIEDPLPLMVADQPQHQPRHQPLHQPRPVVSSGGFKDDGLPWQYLRKYTVKVDKVYKGEERIAARSTINIFTETSEGMCGKDLKIDSRYILAGYYVDGEIFIGLCDWVIEKSQLTKDQRRGLRHTYKKYCDVCKIKSGTLYWPPETKEKEVCPYNPYMMDNDDCEGRYSSCVLLPNGNCNWMETKGLKHCRQKTGSVFS